MFYETSGVPCSFDQLLNFITSIGLSSYIYVLSGIFGLSAFFFRSVFWLRIAVIISGVLGLIFGFLIDQPIVILGNITLVMVNLFQIGLLAIANKPILLPSELKDVYANVFSMMTTKEFLKFIKIGQRRTATDVELCAQGGLSAYIYFLIQGKVNVVKNSNHITTLEKGAFIGEMSFFEKTPYSASVIAEGPIEYVQWDQKQLNELKYKDSRIYMRMLSILGIDLIRKLQNK